MAAGLPLRRSERIGRRRLRGDEEDKASEKQPEKKKNMMKRSQSFTLLGKIQFGVDTKYAPLEVLGTGSYGVVCSCLNRETNETVAIKKISNAFETESTALSTLREIQILRRIGAHENVISLKDVMMSPDFRDVYLVQELMDFDLTTAMKKSPSNLTRSHIRSILFQILTGLKFLHSANVIHRDLKPQNILLNKNTDLKICDFGLARTKLLDPPMTEYTVTRWYRAPEILTGSVWYGPGIDIWSAGCVLAEMLNNGNAIFPGANSLDQINRVFDILGTPSDISFIQSFNFRKYVTNLPRSNGEKFEKMFRSAEPLVVDLLKKMLAVNPWDRISASKALEHRYFLGLYDPDCDGLSPATISLEVDEIEGGVEMTKIRDLMWEEMLFYRPQGRSRVL